MANWITTEEASQISGYSVQYVQRLLRTKKIGGEKKGGAYWVDRDSLQSYLDLNAHSKDARHESRKRRKTTH